MTAFRQAGSKVRGQPLLAVDWNDIIRRLRILEGIVGINQQGYGLGVLTTFQYVSSDGDVILARAINDDLTPGETFALAKPYTHRPSVLTRGGHTYSYTTDFERIDTLAGNPETQILTPGYEVGDIVYAVRAKKYTGVDYDPGAGLTRVRWQQINVDGHQWAQEYVAP